MTTRKERQLARLFASDLAMLTKQGIGYANSIGVAARRVALAAYRDGRDPIAPALHELKRLTTLQSQAMIAAQLRGIKRARIVAPVTIQLATETSEAYRAATSFMRRLLDVPTATLNRMSERYQTDILRVTNDTSRAVERRLREALVGIVEDGAHVQEGVRRLGAVFDAAGIVPNNSFTLEAILRTQTSLAYSAGHASVENDPAIAEILWGYKYVTVGDSRVRPAHVALEGVTLAKDDPWWDKYRPPNGWACRCVLIPLYEPEKVKRPPTTYKTESGHKAPIEPDKGFAFNPATVFADTAAGVPRTAKVKR